MKNKRFVITGIGVNSSIGCEKEKYWQALNEGRSGISQITLFDVNRYKIKLAGEVPNFYIAKDLINPRFNYLDRPTALLLSSTKDAIKDANLNIEEIDASEIGVSVGSTFGSLGSYSKFDLESLTKGPRVVNPSSVPNTSPNIPASQVSIFFNVKGFNITLSTGICSSFDALDFAIKAITVRNKKVVIVGGVEEFCEPLFFLFQNSGMLSGTLENESIISCPFDRKRNGMVLGEGAGVVIVEDLDFALKRNAEIYGEIFGINFEYNSTNSSEMSFDDLNINSVTSCMENVLHKSNLLLSDMDYICCNANSLVHGDFIEAEAINKVSQNLNKGKVPVITSIKSMIGECYSSSGILAIIATLGSLKKNFIPPTINFFSTGINKNLNVVANNSLSRKVNNILINAFDFSGMLSSLVLGRYNDDE